MDDKKRKKLIFDLIFEEDFDSDYSVDSQFWFVDKVVRRFEAQGLSDEKVKEETSKFVQKAAAVVKANRDFSVGLAVDSNPRFTKRLLQVMRKHRVEILYGAIAVSPEFVEPAQLKYLLFIAKRRFRSICRMYVWVNYPDPNQRNPPGGYFRYDHRCRTNNHWRVNDVAVNFWEELTPPWYSNYSPWKLKSSGVADPVKAVEALFTKKSDECKGNLFDCETTTSIVFLDSLREATKEDQFMKKLAATGSEYLLIHGFVTDGHTTNFMADATDHGLFSTVPMPARDLQVGDQCYIINHPLYKVFRPTGSWTGEYSLVYVSGDRDYRSRSGIVFGGHGKEGTLYQFYDAFTSELKSLLAAARQLMTVHLAFMRDGAAAIAPGTVHEEEHAISVGGAPAATFRLLQYEKNVGAKDFKKVPSKKKKKPKNTVPDFVIIQSKTEHVFFLEQVENPNAEKPLTANIKRKISDIVPPGVLEHPIKFERLTAPPSGATPAEIYGLANWGVAYMDETTSTEKLWPFFEVVAGKLQRKELLHDDLFNSPFSLFDPKKTDLEVRRPKVDFGSGHQTFLTSNGAF